jgi:hypothetical protein
MLGNKLPDKKNVLLSDVPAPVSEYRLHGKEYTGSWMRTQALELHYFSPLGSNLSPLWIAVPDQKLELMGF